MQGNGISASSQDIRLPIMILLYTRRNALDSSAADMCISRNQKFSSESGAIQCLDYCVQYCIQFVYMPLVNIRRLYTVVKR